MPGSDYLIYGRNDYHCPLDEGERDCDHHFPLPTGKSNSEANEQECDQISDVNASRCKEYISAEMMLGDLVFLNDGKYRGRDQGKDKFRKQESSDYGGGCHPWSSAEANPASCGTVLIVCRQYHLRAEATPDLDTMRENSSSRSPWIDSASSARVKRLRSQMAVRGGWTCCCAVMRSSRVKLSPSIMLCSARCVLFTAAIPFAVTRKKRLERPPRSGVGSPW